MILVVPFSVNATMYSTAQTVVKGLLAGTRVYYGRVLTSFDGYSKLYINVTSSLLNDILFGEGTFKPTRRAVLSQFYYMMSSRNGRPLVAVYKSAPAYSELYCTLNGCLSVNSYHRYRTIKRGQANLLAASCLPLCCLTDTFISDVTLFPGCQLHRPQYPRRHLACR